MQLGLRMLSKFNGCVFHFKNNYYLQFIFVVNDETTKSMHNYKFSLFNFNIKLELYNLYFLFQRLHLNEKRVDNRYARSKHIHLVFYYIILLMYVDISPCIRNQMPLGRPKPSQLRLGVHGIL